MRKLPLFGRGKCHFVTVDREGTVMLMRETHVRIGEDRCHY
jgi:hypothetical protein